MVGILAPKLYSPLHVPLYNIHLHIVLCTDLSKIQAVNITPMGCLEDRQGEVSHVKYILIVIGLKTLSYFYYFEIAWTLKTDL